MSLAGARIDDLSADDLRRLANELAPYLAEINGTTGRDSDPWLTADQAATHLGCKRDRIYDLVQLGKLTPRRDGRRVLLKRSQLDGYLQAGER